MHAHLITFPLLQLYADGLIIFSVLRFIRLASRHTQVYSYMNIYVGNRSHSYYPDDKTPYGERNLYFQLVQLPVTILIYILGPVHHDDLIYLLTGRGVVADFEVDSPYSKHVAKTTGLWAAFVQNGYDNIFRYDFI